MRKINLLEGAPKVQRRIDANWRTDKNREIAKRFDKEFFDGDRINGYGGYYYDGRWKKVAEKLQEIYRVSPDSSVLDIGCAKGFLLYDLQDMLPGIKVAGLDISKYAINHAMDGFGKYAIKQGIKGKANKLEELARKKVLPFMIKGSAEQLPYANDSFDVVLSINTIHNLPRERCKKAIKEMIRVCKNKKKMFIQVDSYTNGVEKKAMEAWNLTALTVMSSNEWVKFFKGCGYAGDYFWTTLIPEFAS